MPEISPKVLSLRADINKLRDSGYTWVDMSNECGVDRTWIEKFASGKINEPTVTRYDVLKKTMDRLSRRKAG